MSDSTQQPTQSQQDRERDRERAKNAQSSQPQPSSGDRPKAQPLHDKSKDKENCEVVGTVNLKDALQDKGLIKGTLFINGHEFRDFEASSPGEVTRKLNAQSGVTGVRASLDDDFHLVLEGDSPQAIRIGSGRGADMARHKRAIEDRNRNQGDGVSRRPRDADESMDEMPNIVEVLGLTESENPQDGADWQPGESAEDRDRRRKNEGDRNKQPTSVMRGASAADDDRIAREQGKAGGGTSGLNLGPSNTVDADPHAADAARRNTGGFGGDRRDGGMGQSPQQQPAAGSDFPGKKENPSL